MCIHIYIYTLYIYIYIHNFITAYIYIYVVSSWSKLYSCWTRPRSLEGPRISSLPLRKPRGRPWIWSWIDTLTHSHATSYENLWNRLLCWALHWNISTVTSKRLERQMNQINMKRENIWKSNLSPVKMVCFLPKTYSCLHLYTDLFIPFPLCI